MKTLTIAIFCLLGALAFVGASPTDCGISGSVVLERTRFLSTETAEAILTITNSTAHPVFFSKCEVTFLIHTASGWSERSNCMEMIRLPRHTRVEPSSQFVSSIQLPKCDVHSDPCIEDVRVKYAVESGNDVQWYTSSLPRYEFVADPSATFEIPGLKGNRPVFIVPGVARGTVFPDTMVLAFTASPSEAHPPFTQTPLLVSELAKAISEAGVIVGGTGFDSDGDTWRAQISVDHATGQRAAIAAAINRVRQRYATRIAAITHYFVFTPINDAQSITDAAFSQGKRRAQELAAITGARVVELSMFPYSQPHVYLGGPDPNWSFPDLTQSLPFTKPAVLNQTAATPTSVTVVTQDSFVGAKPAEWVQPASTLQSAAQAFRSPDSWFLPPLDPKAVIAADRPELYVIGTASAQAARARGLLPYFAAALHADARASHLAHILGVRPGTASLFADYPMSQDADLRTLGVATTFTGSDHQRWETFKADPNVRVYRSDDSRQRAMVPIDVPDAATTITEMASAMASFSPGRRPLDCSTFEWRLVKATIRKNWNQAQSDAVQSHRKIRKLLLVAVFPMDCQVDGHVFLSSMMVFRTFPAHDST